MLDSDIDGDDNRAALVAPSAFTRRGAAEITLCAEVAGPHEDLAKHSAVDQREDCGNVAGETELK